jgi:hypothetical protein
MELNSKYEVNRQLVRNNSFENEIVIVDGQGRSGKNLISVLISTMKRTEKMRLDSQFDYIPRYYFMGKMSLDAAVVALRTEADEKHYYNSISRDVNFRLADYSGVYRQGKRLIYIARLFMSGDEQAVKRLRQSRSIFQEMTHDGIHVAPLYFEAFGSRLKIIHVFRDPIGNIFEQNKRGFGERIGSDPRELQLTHLWEGNSIPIIAIGREEEYLNGNPLERLVLMVDIMFRRNLQGYFDLDSEYKKQVMFLEFEEFVSHPNTYMDGIAKFIGDEFGRSKKRIMKKENFPRIIDPKTRLERLEQISSNLSAHYHGILNNLIQDYDRKPWLGIGYGHDEKH